MPCFNPLKGYRSQAVNPSGKRSIVVTRRDAFVDLPVTLACGQCMGCRLERSRQWAIRCVHEAKLHKENAFITLTYEDKHLPEGGTLVKSHFQKFMKRLRRAFEDRKIRFFHCGEYGEKTRRPHYHACLFGFDFSDKYHWKTARNGEKYFRSSTLEKLWPHGQSMLGDVTFESAAYVARYITKKRLGRGAEEYYEKVNPVTGEIVDLVPEYVTMSRRPGIGRGFFDLYKGDIYPHDFVVLRGKKMKPPKVYDHYLESLSSREVAAIKAARVVAGEKHADNNTQDRLFVREEILYEKYKQLKRSYEVEN